MFKTYFKVLFKFNILFHLISIYMHLFKYNAFIIKIFSDISSAFKILQLSRWTHNYRLIKFNTYNLLLNVTSYFISFICHQCYFF